MTHSRFIAKQLLLVLLNAAYVAENHQTPVVHIDGVMASALDSRVVGHEFDPQ
jgi:general stress protein CsbA